MIDHALPSLADLLADYSQTKVAQKIERPRAFVFRLVTYRRPLRDSSVIPALARVLRVDEAYLRRIVDNDQRRARIESRKGRAA